MQTIMQHKTKSTTKGVFTKSEVGDYMGIRGDALTYALSKPCLITSKNGVKLNVIDAGNGLAQVEIYSDTYTLRGIVTGVHE